MNHLFLHAVQNATSNTKLNKNEVHKEIVAQVKRSSCQCNCELSPYHSCSPLFHPHYLRGCNGGGQKGFRMVTLSL